MLYKLFIPKQAVGLSLVYFDLFNVAGGQYTPRVISLVPVVSGEAAVTGVLGVDLFLTRTTVVGTGGTTATAEGTSLTAATFSAYDHTAGPINLSAISARLTPSGGATAGAVLSWRSVFSEETNAGTYETGQDMVKATTVPLKIPSGTGIRVVQGGVASVGNIGFDLLLDI